MRVKLTQLDLETCEEEGRKEGGEGGRRRIIGRTKRNDISVSVLSMMQIQSFHKKK